MRPAVQYPAGGTGQSTVTRGSYPAARIQGGARPRATDQEDATSHLSRAEDRRSARPRRVLTGLLVALSVLFLVTATVGVWARAFVVDTERWVETVGPLIEQPEVVSAVSARAAQAIVDELDVEELIRSSPAAIEWLPVEPGAATGPLTLLVRDRLAERIEAALDTDLARRLWIGINRVAHRSALALLRGETREGVDVADGTVSLDLVPLIELALSGAEDLLSDLLGRAIDLPEPGRISAADADAARARIEAALDLDLPEDFGEVVVLRSDTLSALQDGLAALDRSVLFLVMLAVGSTIAAIALSTDRRRTLVQLGVGLLLAFLATRLAILVAMDAIVGLAADESRGAARETIGAVFVSLLNATTLLIAVSLVVALVAYLAGRPTRLGRARG